MTAAAWVISAVKFLDAPKGHLLDPLNEEGAKATSIEATTEPLDDLQQVVRVLLNNPARFLRARQLGRRLILTRVRFFGRFHTGTVGADPKGAIELNQSSSPVSLGSS